MPPAETDLVRLVTQGADALRGNRPADARRALEAVTQTGRGNVQVWLLLATACRALDDRAAEEAALDAVLALDAKVVRARIMKADCRVHAGDEGTALGLYTSALALASGHQVPDDLARELARVEAAVAHLKAQRETRREGSLIAQGLPPGDRSERFQRSLDLLAGRKQIFVQDPTSYYFPDLPAIPFFDRQDFAWAPAVEAATGAIREELAAIVADGGGDFRPYLHGDANRPRVDDSSLLDSADWSALFLCENGRVFDEAVACAPRTWAAMQAAPLPWIAQSPTVMFSLLRPGARIAPHTGTHNARLICHLPIVVPPGCGFRVGSEQREWREGELLVFDDSIEHEAWNDSDRDRVVLIFDIWRPDLSDRERREVGALFEAALLD